MVLVLPVPGGPQIIEIKSLIEDSIACAEID
jgi:hypothetical protein